MATEAQKNALKKYKANVKRFTVDFPASDADVYEHLQKQPNKQGYIKALIRADMEREAKRKAQFPNIPLSEFEIEIEAPKKTERKGGGNNGEKLP